MGRVGRDDQHTPAVFGGLDRSRRRAGRLTAAALATEEEVLRRLCVYWLAVAAGLSAAASRRTPSVNLAADGCENDSRIRRCPLPST